MTIELKANIKLNKTGAPTDKEMEAAKSLTSNLINDIGRHRLAAVLGVKVPTTYQYKLIPAESLPRFCAILAPETPMEKLRPDMFVAKK